MKQTFDYGAACFTFDELLDGRAAVALDALAAKGGRVAYVVPSGPEGLYFWQPPEAAGKFGGTPMRPVVRVVVQHGAPCKGIKLIAMTTSDVDGNGGPGLTRIRELGAEGYRLVGVAATEQKTQRKGACLFVVMQAEA